jgi:haloalkane dehalogenase
MDLRNISFIANDFGGGIALYYAIRYPGNIYKIILFNTWLRSLREDSHFSGPARMMNTAVGKFLYLHWNFSVNVIMPSAYGNKKRLTKEIHRHYKMALPKGSRVAAYTFAREIMNASEWWQHVWDQLDKISPASFLFFWGMKDKFILPSELQRWRSKLPNARVITFEDAGHFIHEEKPVEMIREIKSFIETPFVTHKKLT